MKTQLRKKSQALRDEIIVSYIQSIHTIVFNTI